MIKQAGPLNFNVNYTFSKALGILGSSADFNWTAGIDPFHLGNNYGPMNFDRTQVLNLSYSYQTGRFSTDRVLGGFINQWLVSGITNVQSGPDMQTGVSASPGYYVQGNIGQGANGYAVSNTTILGTPDVNLQPLSQPAVRPGVAPVPEPELLRTAEHGHERAVYRTVRARAGVLQHGLCWRRASRWAASAACASASRALTLSTTR